MRLIDKDCPDRCIGCHSACAKYKDFRAACDAVSAAKRREFAANEAGALRGDKIRRDAHLEERQCQGGTDRGKRDCVPCQN